MAEPTRTVLLFTHTFPAGEGEPFVAPELPFLLERFRSVQIIPLWAQAGRSRAVPERVTVGEPLFAGAHPRLTVLRRGLLNAAPVHDLLPEVTRIGRAHLGDRLTRYGYTALLARSLRSRSDLRALLAPAGGCDVAYFYWGNGAVSVVPFLRDTIPLVARFHRGDLYEDASSGYLPFQPQVMRRLDHLVFISRHGLRDAVSRHREIEPRAHLFPLGVPDRGRNPTPARGSHRIVSCSFAAPVKRLHLIAQALRHVQSPLEWVHLGAGPELERVRALTRDRPGHVSVRFLGQLEHDQVDAYFRSEPIDLFINVSESEGVPVSVMEALSFGVPVLATDVGGTSEIVEPPWGRLMPVDLSPQSLARVIDEALQAPDALSRDAAREAWASRACVERNSRAFAAFLHAVAVGGAGVVGERSAWGA